MYAEITRQAAQQGLKIEEMMSMIRFLHAELQQQREENQRLTAMFAQEAGSGVCERQADHVDFDGHRSGGLESPSLSSPARSMARLPTLSSPPASVCNLVTRYRQLSSSPNGEAARAQAVLSAVAAALASAKREHGATEASSPSGRAATDSLASTRPPSMVLSRDANDAHNISEQSRDTNYLNFMSGCLSDISIDHSRNMDGADEPDTDLEDLLEEMAQDRRLPHIDLENVLRLQDARDRVSALGVVRPKRGTRSASP